MVVPPTAPPAGPSSPHPPTIETRSLTYRFPDGSPGLTDVTLSLPAGGRTLLIGANGAGKTTLLRLLAGKKLATGAGSSAQPMIAVCGVDPFRDTAPGVAYLGLEWVLQSPVRTSGSVGAAELVRSVGGDAWPERRDELVAVLDVDLEGWKATARLSDGERRRVQLCLGLVAPWRVLLLDEVTVDLDVLARARLLDWIRRETERRVCTVLYATHVLDGLAGWPTHLVHMHLGTVREWGPTVDFLRGLDELEAREEEEAAAAGKEVAVGGEEVVPWTKRASNRGNSRLGELALRWLAQDLKDRGPRNTAKLQPEGRSYDFGGGIGGYGYEPGPPPESDA